ncbi:hypothetical protein GQX74_012983 [Glossina fuscipes]|nr:hypothetical protein GQX74_012983 [Glossina fuscipes]
MQEVCSTFENQIGAQIKSESPLNALQVQTGQTIVPVAPPQVPQTAAMIVNKMGPNCDKRTNEPTYWMASEGGFINSQPSMAEFLNHLSPESPKLGSGGTPIGAYTVGAVPQTQDGIDSVPEYPWMKEKKTSRKSSNSNQGHLEIHPILPDVPYYDCIE